MPVTSSKFSTFPLNLTFFSSPLNLEILNLTECEYLISIVKKQKEASATQ